MSGEELLHNLAVDVGEAEITALGLVGEFGVVETKQVQ